MNELGYIESNIQKMQESRLEQYEGNYVPITKYNWPTCQSCKQVGEENPAAYLAPQSLNGGNPFDRWMLICKECANWWWDSDDWYSDMLILDKIEVR